VSELRSAALAVATLAAFWGAVIPLNRFYDRLDRTGRPRPRFVFGAAVGALPGVLVTLAVFVDPAYVVPAVGAAVVAMVSLPHGRFRSEDSPVREAALAGFVGALALLGLVALVRQA
jgi:hypothetical protein